MLQNVVFTKVSNGKKLSSSGYQNPQQNITLYAIWKLFTLFIEPMQGRSFIGYLISFEYCPFYNTIFNF